MEKIFKAVRKAIRIPLTIKIRSGWDRNSINAVEVMKLAQDNGIEALAIHGRTRCDLFSGQADWKVIARVKEQARIPVIGNGDVVLPSDAERMFQETGVDGVMIGRGILSNPWLIRQCWDYLCGKEIACISLRERADFMTEFLRRVSTQSPPAIVLGKMKKIGGHLSKGFPGGSRLRARMHAARTTSEFFEAINNYGDSHQNLEIT
jgi:nifR3 family TIM-barrel protein